MIGVAQWSCARVAGWPIIFIHIPPACMRRPRQLGLSGAVVKRIGWYMFSSSYVFTYITYFLTCLRVQCKIIDKSWGLFQSVWSIDENFIIPMAMMWFVSQYPSIIIIIMLTYRSCWNKCGHTMSESLNDANNLSEWKLVDIVSDVA